MQQNFTSRFEHKHREDTTIALVILIILTLKEHDIIDNNHKNLYEKIYFFMFLIIQISRSKSKTSL